MPASSLCSLVDSLYADGPALKLIYLVQFSLSFVGVAAQICVVLRLYASFTTSSLYSPSVRILLFNLAIALLGANTGTLLTCIYPLHVFLLRPAGSRCYWLSFTHTDCVWLESIRRVCTFAIYICPCALTIERLSSALLPNNYGSSISNGGDSRSRVVSTGPSSSPKWTWNGRRARLVAYLLTTLQWCIAIGVMVFPLNGGPLITSPSSANPLTSRSAHHSSPSSLYPHCYAHLQPAIQHRHYFYLSLGMQFFSLTIFSTLTYHYSSALVRRELAATGYSSTLHDNVQHTGRMLPIVLALVGFFVANCALDRNLVLTILDWANIRSVGQASSRDLLPNVYWSELQTTFTAPLLSVVILAIVGIQTALASDDEGELGENDEEETTCDDLYELVASEFTSVSPREYRRSGGNFPDVQQPHTATTRKVTVEPVGAGDCFANQVQELGGNGDTTVVRQQPPAIKQKLRKTDSLSGLAMSATGGNGRVARDNYEAVRFTASDDRGEVTTITRH